MNKENNHLKKNNENQEKTNWKNILIVISGLLLVTIVLSVTFEGFREFLFIRMFKVGKENAPAFITSFTPLLLVVSGYLLYRRTVAMDKQVENSNIIADAANQNVITAQTRKNRQLVTTCQNLKPKKAI